MRIYSAERNRKISESRKGMKFTEEHKLHLRESRKHQIIKHSDATKKKIGDGNRGKIHSPETLEKQRLSHLGKKQSKETIEKRRAKQIGRKMPPLTEEQRRVRKEVMSRPEVRKKIGDAHRGTHHTDITKQKLRLVNLGKHHSESTRKLIGNSSKGRHLSDSARKKIGDAHRGKTLSQSARDKVGAAHKGLKKSEETMRKLKASFTPERRKQMSEQRKGQPHHPVSPEGILKIKEHRLHQVFPNKDTKIELKVQDELSSREYAYYKHYPIVGQPDIAFLDQKIAVFCDGDAVHGFPEQFKPEDKNCFGTPIKEKWARDKFVNEELQKLGWLVLRYWEHEINDNVEAVVDLSLIHI